MLPETSTQSMMSMTLARSLRTWNPFSGPASATTSSDRPKARNTAGPRIRSVRL